MDYLQWQGLRSALPHLAKPFADEAFSFQSAVFGVAVQPPRECRLLRHLWLSRQSRCIIIMISSYDHHHDIII